MKEEYMCFVVVFVPVDELLYSGMVIWFKVKAEKVRWI